MTPMRIGTKSVLFGAHCFLLHWFFVAWGWVKAFGWGTTTWTLRNSADGSSLGIHLRTGLWDPRLWLAFLIHDLGYLGSPNMDGEEGERHPEWAALLMGELFGTRWYYFCLLHSRYYAKQLGYLPSALCFADKLVLAVEPWWLYLPRVRWSGEVDEYLKTYDVRQANGEPVPVVTATERRARERAWYQATGEYMARWVAAHKGGTVDTWTATQRTPSAEGTWQ